MSLTLLEPIIVNTAATFTFANANVTSNLAAGNITITGVYTGNGSGLTNLPASNITGQVANALVAGTVYTNAQPNITSVGTLTSLGVSGNIVAANITANTGVFAGNGSGLTNLPAGNITGQVANALVAGTVYTNAQPNITSVGLLSSLSVGPNSSVVLTGTSGFVRANAIQGTDGVAALYPAYNGVTGAVGVLSNLTVGIGAAGNITANGNVTANLFTGTLTTSAQPNITSVGTLTTLNVSGFSTFYASQDRFSTITGATGVVTHDLANGGIFYHTSPVANFTPNFTNVPTTNNYTTVAVLFITQGATPRLPTATSNIQIGGSNVTIRWGGGSAPSGTANGVDMVSFSLIRNAGAWIVLGQAGGFS